VTWTEEEDRAFLAAADGDPRNNGHQPGGERETARLLSISDLAALPEPTWLLDGMLPAGFAVLFGPSNAGKSFLALDWALCIASGVAWYGQDTQPGWVVYIAAEGVSGLYRRVQAWTHARALDAPERIRFIPHAANLLQSADVDRVKNAILSLPESPALVVIDTMARSMVGGDENAAKDVGRYIAAVDELRHEYDDGASLTVHHTGKDGDDERGSSALRGASDAVLALKPDGAGVKLECIKQKDAAPFEPWRLHLAETLESCVLRSGTSPGQLAPAERQILNEVSAAFGTNPASRTAIREAANIPKTTWHRSIKSLIDRGYLAADGNARNAPLYLTEDGHTQTVPPSPTKSHGTGQRSPTETVPIGDGGTWDNTGTPQPTARQKKLP
jgi:hypothetical protein